MEYNEFFEEMKRIEAMFGEKHYGNERKEMIWRRVRGFSQNRFRAVCDDLIGYCRTFPVVRDFDEAASKIREQDAYLEQQELSLSLKKFFSQPEVAELFQFTRDKLDGKISKEEFDERMRILKRTIEIENKNNPPPCCTDGMIGAKLITTGDRFIFRCHCQRGQQYPAIPPWASAMQHRYELES